MAKLKCVPHGRRVFVIDGTLIHRSDIGDGNGTRCGAQTAIINDKIHLAKSEHFHAS